MHLFDPYPDFGGNDERAVLCHEVGHGVAWFTFCGVVGSVILTRQSNEEGIEADILLLPRDGKQATQENEDHHAPYAVRLIAGDVAYRKAMRRREGMMSLRGFPPNRNYTLEGILYELERDGRHDDDVYKIITIALRAAPTNPFAWLWARLADAVRVVNLHWATIVAIADRLYAGLPLEGQVAWIPGTNLLTWMMEGGIEAGQRPPLELIHWQDPICPVISIARLWRRARGKHGVLRVKKRT